MTRMVCVILAAHKILTKTADLLPLFLGRWQNLGRTCKWSSVTGHSRRPRCRLAVM